MNTPESSRFRFVVRTAEEAVTVLRESSDLAPASSP